MDQLDRVNEGHAEQLRSLVVAECYVSSDLLKLESYLPHVFAYRAGLRDSLKTKLLKVSMERLKLAREHERDVRDLHGRLLEAMEKLKQLEF
jgi:hypothetical protein